MLELLHSRMMAYSALKQKRPSILLGSSSYISSFCALSDPPRDLKRPHFSYHLLWGDYTTAG
jgi:hypothetical protein